MTPAVGRPPRSNELVNGCVSIYILSIGEKRGKVNQMIRIEIDRGKTVVEIKGIFPVVSSEITYALEKIYDAIAERTGKEAAKIYIKRMAELAVMDSEKLKENTDKILEENQWLDSFADFIIDRFMR